MPSTIARCINRDSCPPSVVLGSSLIFVWTDGFFMRQFVSVADGQSFAALLAFAGMFLVSCIPLCAAMCVRPLSGRFPRLRPPLPVQAVVAFGLSATVCSLSFPLSESLGSPVLFAIGTLSGVGYAVCLLEWGRIYGRKRGLSTYLTLPAVFATSIILDVPLLLLPDPAGTVAFSLMPFVSSVFLAFARRHERGLWADDGARADVPPRRIGAESNAEVILGASKTRKLLGVPAAFLFGIALFNLAFGYMQFTTSFSTISTTISSTVVTLTRGGAALVMLLGMGLFGIKPHRVFQVGLMIAIAGFIAVPVVSDPTSTQLVTLMASIVIVGDTACDMFIWILGSEYTRFDDRENPDFRPFALIHVTVACALVLGLFVGWFSFSPQLFPRLFSPVTTVICYLLVVSVALFLVGDANIWTLLKLELSHEEDSAAGSGAGGAPQLAYNFEVFCTENGLSARQKDVLRLILEGRSVKRAAEELDISESTVVTHIRNLYRKFDCHSRQELIDRVHGA